jgi:hypothetical protein
MGCRDQHTWAARRRFRCLRWQRTPTRIPLGSVDRHPLGGPCSRRPRRNRHHGPLSSAGTRPASSSTAATRGSPRWPRRLPATLRSPLPDRRRRPPLERAMDPSRPAHRQRQALYVLYGLPRERQDCCGFTASEGRIRNSAPRSGREELDNSARRTAAHGADPLLSRGPRGREMTRSRPAMTSGWRSLCRRSLS